MYIISNNTHKLCLKILGALDGILKYTGNRSFLKLKNDALVGLINAEKIAPTSGIKQLLERKEKEGLRAFGEVITIDGKHEVPVWQVQAYRWTVQESGGSKKYATLEVWLPSSAIAGISSPTNPVTLGDYHFLTGQKIDRTNGITELNLQLVEE